jgi:signal transduction histidine kinase
VLIYTAANALLASYALASRRAEEARARNRALAGELEATNRALEAHLARARQLAAAQERHHLARELHDSATQTVFSMVLAAQSASLLLERDPAAAGAQLERLSDLAQSALSEIRALISELRPERLAEGGLVPALRQLSTGPEFARALSVDVQVEGDERLPAREEEGLVRIATEALKNIVKHAGTTQASIRLHLAEPFWMEIEDRGRGFQLESARAGGHIGLSVMSERAAEIGWDLQVVAAPGAGTRVRAEKKPPEEEQR